MKIENLGEAGRVTVVKITCDCGKTEYATLGRWSGFHLQPLSKIIETLKKNASSELRDAEAPRIRHWTRESHRKIADAYETLVSKLEELI